MKRRSAGIAVAMCTALLVSGCAQPATPWHVELAHQPVAPARTATPGGASTGVAARLLSASSSGASIAAAARSCVGSIRPRVYAHVIWIVMENKAATRVVGPSDAPTTTALARQCGSVRGYRAVTHPSLPNYLALATGSTRGVTDDAGPSSHPIAGPSVFSALRAAHKSWMVLAESMPKPCASTSSGRYAVKHNPLPYLTAERATCRAHDLALGTTHSGPLSRALSSGRLPAFTLVVPDMCHDTHDCSVRTGDTWLHQWLAAISASSTYRAGRTVVFITWDEDDRSHANTVALLVMARSIRPGRIVTGTGQYNHRSLLATTLDLLGVHRLATVARAPSMRGPLGL